MARWFAAALCLLVGLVSGCHEPEPSEAEEEIEGALPACAENPVHLHEFAVPLAATLFEVAVERFGDELLVQRVEAVGEPVDIWQIEEWTIDTWQVDACGGDARLLESIVDDDFEIGMASEWLLRCDRDTGALAWVDPAGAQADRPLLPASTDCSVVPAAGGLAAVDPMSGELWFHPDPDDRLATPWVVSEDLFVPEHASCSTMNFADCVVALLPELVPPPVVASLGDALLVTHADLRTEVLDPHSGETQPIAAEVVSAVPFTDPRWIVGRRGDAGQSPTIWLFDRQSGETRDLGSASTWKFDGDWLAVGAGSIEFDENLFEVFHVPSGDVFSIAPLAHWNWLAAEGDSLLLRERHGSDTKVSYWLIDPIHELRTLLASIDGEHREPRLEADGLLVHMCGPHDERCDLDLYPLDASGEPTRLASQVLASTWRTPTGELVRIEPATGDAPPGTLYIDDPSAGTSEAIAERVLTTERVFTPAGELTATVLYVCDDHAGSGLWRFDVGG